MCDHFAQWFVWLGLTLDTAENEVSEVTINAHGNDRSICRRHVIKCIVELVETE
jgi:hypothetical protein